MFWYIYKTISTGNIYPLEFGFKQIKVADICYEPEDIWNRCREGCKNFNRSGGCPPFSPKLEALYEPNDDVWLIYCLFLSKYKPESIMKSLNTAIHWKFQDAILAKILANVGNKLRSKLGGDFLSTGYCMGCPGKKCGFKLGIGCRNPDLRTYSMEATGINVVSTVKKVFNIDTYWYRKGESDKVPYMIKTIAYFPPKNFKENMEGNLIYVLNSLNTCYLPIGSIEYNIFLSQNCLVNKINL